MGREKSFPTLSRKFSVIYLTKFLRSVHEIFQKIGR